MAAPARDIPPTEPRSWKQRLPNPLEWTALVLFGLSVLILVSLLLDPPSRHLRGVGGGTFLSRQPFLFLGAGIYILAGLTAFWSAIIFFRNRIHNLALKAFGITLMAVSFSTLLCICTDSRASEVYFGGYVGSLLGTALSGMSPLLSATLVGMLFLISSVFATDWFFYELIRGEARFDYESYEDLHPAPLPPVERPARAAAAPAAAPTEPAPGTAPGTATGTAADPWSQPATAPSSGPRIMRRVIPKLDHAQPVPEPTRDEEPAVVEEEGARREALAYDTGSGAEAVIANETEHAADDETAAGEADAPAIDGGYRFFLPDDESEDADEEAEETPSFVGRIAAYEEDEEEDQEAEFDAEPLDADDEADLEEETLLEAEEDELEDEETAYDDALEDEIEIVASHADRVEAAGPPVSKNVFEVIAAADEDEIDVEEEEGSEADDENEDPIEAPPVEAPEDADHERVVVETSPVSDAELALYEDSEPEARAEYEDPIEETLQEDIELEVEAAAEADDAKPEVEEALEEEELEEEEEVFQLDLEEEDEDDAVPASGMVFPEALEDLPAARLAGSEAESEVEADEPVAEEPEFAEESMEPAEVIDGDPFADAPVTGTLFEDALPATARKRRVRPSAARVDRAIDELMPSLDRMKKKINELETDVDPESPSRAFEAGEDTARA